MKQPPVIVVDIVATEQQPVNTSASQSVEKKITESTTDEGYFIPCLNADGTLAQIDSSK